MEAAVTRGKTPTKVMALLIAAGLVLSGCVADYGYAGPAYVYADPSYEAAGYYGWGGWHHGWDHGHWDGHESHVGLAPGHWGHGLGGHGAFGGHGGFGGHVGGGGHGGGGHR
jgi:hypothetical protein